MDNKKIFTLADVKAEGKAIAFVEGNRNLGKANFEGKMVSLQETEGNITPMMLMNGEDVVKYGLHLVEADTIDNVKAIVKNEPKEINDADAGNYYVVIDGQHRYVAYMLMKDEDYKKKSRNNEVRNIYPLTESQLHFYVDYSGKSAKVLLSHSNVACYRWDNKAMAKAACTYNPDNDLAKFINKYMNECNYTISTLGIYLTGNDYQCKKDTLDNFVKGKKPTFNYDIEQAQALMEATETVFGKSFAKKRTYAKPIMDLSREANDYHKVIDAINKLGIGEVEVIKKTKGEDVPNILREKIEEHIKITVQLIKIFLIERVITSVVAFFLL